MSDIGGYNLYRLIQIRTLVIFLFKARVAVFYWCCGFFRCFTGTCPRVVSSGEFFRGKIILVFFPYGLRGGKSGNIVFDGLGHPWCRGHTGQMIFTEVFRSGSRTNLRSFPTTQKDAARHDPANRLIPGRPPNDQVGLKVQSSTKMKSHWHIFDCGRKFAGALCMKCSMSHVCTFQKSKKRAWLFHYLDDDNSTLKPTFFFTLCPAEDPTRSGDEETVGH